MKSKGFTLAELLVCAAILAALTAIAFPVYRSAVNRSKETQCVNTLHRLGEAVSLYRTNYDGDGRYGEASAMGLPRYFYTVRDTLGLPLSAFQCTLPLQGSGGKLSPFWQLYFFPDGDQDMPRWPDYAREYQDASIIIADFQHDPNFSTRSSPFAHHRAIGLYLGGQVKTRTKMGD